MRYIDEFRDAGAIRAVIGEAKRLAARTRSIMEVCGGQTHTIVRYGLDRLLSPEVNLIHGPGCPVCVTPLEMIDAAIEISLRPGVILTSFGDMLRVPGSRGDLFSARGEGADVRVVYSPLDAVEIAAGDPSREVVFFAVGFETTAPVNALAVKTASVRGIENFSIIASHVLVPPALEAILSDPECRVEGFIMAGHVATVVGADEYRPLAEKYRVPIVVTGFEPLDIAQGVLLCVRQMEEGRHDVENQYARSVRREGNIEAVRLMGEVFEVSSRAWRGIGEIPSSGLVLKEEYRSFDALVKFPPTEMEVREETGCIAAEVLKGKRRPDECPSFGSGCSPDDPKGAPMVSSEGACAAYYRYRGVG